MPNHVTNVITPCPSVVEAMTRHHTDQEKTESRRRSAESAARYAARTGEDWPYAEQDSREMEERFVDFALLVPTPDGYIQDSCGAEHQHGFVGRGPDSHPLCWYSWNPAHWGTKWNGYSTVIEPVAGDLCRLKFQTAWSHPWPIVAALAERFPDETIHVEWADEDFGSNLGTYRIEGGQAVDLAQPEHGTAEANELAARLLYGKPYAEVQAEWDRASIEDARSAMFCKRIEDERGVDNGYTVIREEGLDVPDDIKQAISTPEQANAYWVVAP